MVGPNVKENNDLLGNLTTKLTECLALGENYKFLIDRCYYIDTTQRTLSAAKAHCNTVFSSIGRTGKIFEPVDTNTFNTIKKTADTFSNKYYWIGFVRKDGTNWNQISDGLPAPNVWGSYTNDNEPYLIFHTGNQNWYDQPDSSSWQSICEVI